MIDDATLIAKLKSFKGHAGRPGKVGGSLPKGQTNVKAPKRPPIMFPGAKADKVSIGTSSTKAGAIALAEEKVGKDWIKTHRIKKLVGGDWHVLERVGGIVRQPSSTISQQPTDAIADDGFFHGDPNSVPVKTIFKQSSKKIQDLAVRTGVLALDEEMKSI